MSLRTNPTAKTGHEVDFELNASEAENPHALPPLPYSYASLEPWIDEDTMHFHHDKHHKAYVDKLNEALAKENVAESSLDHLIQNISQYSKTVRNNAGGHWNHSFFWEILSPHHEDQVLPSRIEEALRKNFGSLDKFKEEFMERGKAQFGSGWVWLIRDYEGSLRIISTPNQDNPFMDICPERGTPLLACDLWEHAYYLKYQNKREDFLKGFWSFVNWSKVDELLGQAISH